jgi:hypothetical protein
MFYLSPSVKPSYNDLEEMIRSAGGSVLRDVPNINCFYETFIDEKKTVHHAKLIFMFWLLFKKYVCFYRD